MAAPALPAEVRRLMATRDHRYRHYLWHALRNGWPRFTAAQRRDILAAFPGWEPPRPAVDAQGNRERDNLSGEDFLFMHRQMIVEVDAILQRIGDPQYPKVTGWTKIPAPGDADYPVVLVPGQGLEAVKSDEHYHQVLAPWERQYMSREYLRRVTLGQLGSDLEFTIHNNLHMRFTEPSTVGYRPRTALTQPVETRWDDPAYDYLGDAYSSHANPIFWKLHGWVDDRIDDWAAANGVVGPIRWTGTWVGPMAHHHAHEDGTRFALVSPQGDDIGKLEAVAAIVGASTAFDGFLTPARVLEKVG